MTAKQADFHTIIDQILELAKQAGATEAVAQVSSGTGLNVSVRHGELETLEHTRDQAVWITAYQGKQSGSASTSDFSTEALRQTVEAALNIARHTAADSAAGLPEAHTLATEFPDLDLHHPWGIDAPQAQELARRTEAAALAADHRISNSEGACVNTHSSDFLLGNSLGFRGGYQASSHSISASVIAGQGSQMQSDYWYSSERNPARLPDPEAIGRTAAERTVAKLNPRRIATGSYPVLFEAPLAIGLLGHLTRAISGSLLYRKTSFLQEQLGQRILPAHISIYDDPYVLGGAGSSAFDDEGVQTQARYLVEEGVLQGYLLSTYSARKLGLVTTGNSGGSHNVSLRSAQTQAQDTFEEMLKKLGTGVLLTELIGQGVNYVTGDYSRGAFGYWVENGQIQYPIEEFTVAGNLRDMFSQIAAVGNDSLTRGAKTTGSVLISSMAVAGT